MLKADSFREDLLLLRKCRITNLIRLWLKLFTVLVEFFNEVLQINIPMYDHCAITQVYDILIMLAEFMISDLSQV